MASGGRRQRSGPAPDPLSRTSLINGREFTVLPLEHDLKVPEFPLPEPSSEELHRWTEAWKKPQAAMWDRLGIHVQVAFYVRSFVRGSAVDGPVSIIQNVLRMEAELGISTSGMLQNGWVLETPAADGVSSAPSSSGGEKKRQTSTGTWLSGVKVEEA